MASLRCKSSWLASLLLFGLLSATAAAQDTDEPTLSIYNSSTEYHYVGCWNETTGIAQSTGARALPDLSMTQPDTMTVEICLDFCAHNQSTAYKYAGLEYSRECYCANKLSRLSVQLNDSVCDTACDGQKGEACGGALKLSLYNITTTDEAKNGASSVMVDTMNWGILAAMALVAVTGLF